MRIVQSRIIYFIVCDIHYGRRHTLNLQRKFVGRWRLSNLESLSTTYIYRFCFVDKLIVAADISRHSSVRDVIGAGRSRDECDEWTANLRYASCV